MSGYKYQAMAVIVSQSLHSDVDVVIRGNDLVHALERVKGYAIYESLKPAHYPFAELEVLVLKELTPESPF